MYENREIGLQHVQSQDKEVEGLDGFCSQHSYPCLTLRNLGPHNCPFPKAVQCHGGTQQS